jgi:ABC-type molybdate transport system substrate-binding protein
VGGVEIPAQYNVVATYPLASVKGTANPATTHEFIFYVLSSAAQALLASYGFQPA